MVFRELSMSVAVLALGLRVEISASGGSAGVPLYVERRGDVVGLDPAHAS